MGFRVCFTPLTGVLFTVPSRYCSLSVTSCSLPWTVVGPASHRIARVPWYSRYPVTVAFPTRTGLSPALVGRSRPFCVQLAHGCGGGTLHDRSHNPSRTTRACLACGWFRRRPVSLATTPGGVLFPPGTEMFQFPDLPPNHPTVVGLQPVAGGVAPFGHGWIPAWLPLPILCAADQRPSSARRAQASSHRASFLAWSLVSRH